MGSAPRLVGLACARPPTTTPPLIALGETLFTVSTMPPCAVPHAGGVQRHGKIVPPSTTCGPAPIGVIAALRAHRRDTVVPRQPHERAEVRARALRLEGAAARGVAPRCGPVRRRGTACALASGRPSAAPVARRMIGRSEELARAPSGRAIHRVPREPRADVVAGVSARCWSCRRDRVRDARRPAARVRPAPAVVPCIVAQPCSLSWHVVWGRPSANWPRPVRATRHARAGPTAGLHRARARGHGAFVGLSLLIGAFDSARSPTSSRPSGAARLHRPRPRR